ncbi:cytochrome c oxidase assembly protein [Sedimenticola hydrogenitrophicus]|uniref:cytochrome c oxidase assembly protein n=1 Tax=Sedimenticola hydrogenitrophicus TaxID=2967975 RepID=UPI0021A691E5
MKQSARQQSNRTLALKLAGITLAMFGFGFALVPLYEVFCDITGLNGKGVKQITAMDPTTVDGSRWVTVEFLSGSNLAGGWEFRPSQSRLRVQPGRLYTVSYQARNPTDQAMTVRAVSSIAPGTAAGYVSKLECFCFRQQRFAPAEQRMMPVRFMVDRALPPEVGTISIAYTLFNSLNREAAPGS